MLDQELFLHLRDNSTRELRAWLSNVSYVRVCRSGLSSPLSLLLVEADADTEGTGAIGDSEVRHGDSPAATTSNAISVPTTSDAFVWYDSEYDDIVVAAASAS